MTVPERRRGGRFVGRSTIGFGALVLGALGLAALFVAGSGAIVAVDRAVAAGLNSLVAPHPAAVVVLQVLTVPGENLFGWVVVTTLALYVLLRGQRRLAVFVAVGGLGGAVLGPTVKALVDRVRPVVDIPVATAPGPSFPSGHALTATVTVGLLLLVLLPAVPERARRPLIAAGALVVGVVAFTRIALGVHFLSDVVAGILLGVGWLAVAASALRSWRRREGLPTPPVDRGLEPEAAADLAPAPDSAAGPGTADGHAADRASGSSAEAHPWTVAAQLLVAAVLLLGVVLGCGLLITQVLPGSAVERFDLGVVGWAAERRVPALDALSYPAAELGNTGVVIAVGLVAVALTLAVRRRWRPALVLVVALVGQFAIFMTAVTVIGRPRPPVPHLDAALPPTSSFPSGHTAAALCLYGALAALVWTSTRAWWRWLVLAVAVAVVVLVAAARLYRGAHFPTDVLGSVLFAVPWLLVTVRLLDPPPPATRIGPAEHDQVYLGGVRA